MKSVLSEEKYQHLEKVVNDFGGPGGVGEKLQEELIKKHDSMDNWVSANVS